MLDADDLDKQEPSTGLGTMSRSGSGGSLPERPASGGGLSRSGSASSLTSPIAKAPDGPSAKGAGLRHSHYVARQGQDLTGSPKTFKKDIDAAIQSVREEMKLCLAQQQLLLHQELQRSMEPVNEELKRLASHAAPRQGDPPEDAVGRPLADQVAALQEKLGRTASALAVLTERVDQKQKLMEDRIEDEMTEVTKAMTQLSEESQKPLKLAEDAAAGVEKLGGEFRAWKAHSQEDQAEGRFKEVREELAGLRQHLAEAAKQAEDAVLASEGLRGEMGDLRRQADGLLARAKGVLEEAGAAPGRAMEEQCRALRAELRSAAEASEEAKRLAAAANLHARSQIAALQEGLTAVRRELAHLADAEGGRAGPGDLDREVSRQTASSSDTESRQLLSLQDRFEGELKEVKKGLARVKKHVKRAPSLARSLVEDPDREHGLQEELRTLKRSTSELAAQTQRMQQDFADATGSMREELRRLAELAACPGRAGAPPVGLEGLQHDAAPYQERLLARSLEGTMTPLSEGSMMEGGAWEQEDLARTMASVRKELLRAKDLFQSGQKSAGVVMSDVEILKQDLQALKESYPALGESSLEKLRDSLRQELADEFRSLAEALLPEADLA